MMPLLTGDRTYDVATASAGRSAYHFTLRTRHDGRVRRVTFALEQATLPRDLRVMELHAMVEEIARATMPHDTQLDGDDEGFLALALPNLSCAGRRKLALGLAGYLATHGPDATSHRAAEIIIDTDLKAGAR